MTSSSPRRSCHHFSLHEIADAINHFVNSKFLGHGGEGNVYLTKVHIEGKDTWVAVKLLNLFSNVLEKEIQTVPKIQHPHILSLLGYCEESGMKILVYEYMKNGSLYDYVRGSRSCLSWLQRLNICLGAARGLQHLHTPTKEFPYGIIHRDVKPANILVNANWVGKVSDFRMFKLSHVGQKKSSMATNLKGTTGYYAPEYVQSHSVTRRIDVYAFGVVLFEVLCGKMPWDRGGESYYRRDDEDLGFWAQKNVDIKIKGEIAVDSLKVYTEIINRSLRRKSDERPTMNDVVLDLEKVLKCQELHDEAKKLHDCSAEFLPMGTREEYWTREEIAEKKNTEELHIHRHKLVKLKSNNEFMCCSCHILGTGKRYCCSPCDFNIHEDCATCPGIQLPLVHPHPLNLVMINKEEATLPICDVCDEPVEGLIYRCIDFDFGVHPLCTQYQQNIWHLCNMMHPLTLQTSTPSWCMVCGEECSYWKYSCGFCAFNIHTECISKGSASSSTCGSQAPPFGGTSALGLPLVLLQEDSYKAQENPFDENQAKVGGASSQDGKGRKMTVLLESLAAGVLSSAIKLLEAFR